MSLFYMVFITAFWEDFVLNWQCNLSIIVMEGPQELYLFTFGLGTC